MNDTIGPVLPQIGDIAPFFLGHHPAYIPEAFNHLFTLFIIEVGKPFVFSDGGIGKEPHGYFPMKGTLVDNVYNPGVNDVSGYAHIYGLHTDMILLQALGFKRKTMVFNEEDPGPISLFPHNGNTP
jgi:hypothetical protein